MATKKLDERTIELQESIMNNFEGIDKEFHARENARLAPTLVKFKNYNPSLVCKLIDAKFKVISKPYREIEKFSKSLVRAMAESYMAAENGFRAKMSSEAVEKYMNTNGKNDREIEKFSKSLVRAMAESYMAAENGFRAKMSSEAVEKYMNTNGKNDREVQELAFNIISEGLSDLVSGIVEYNGREFVVSIDGTSKIAKIYSAEYMKQGEELSVTYNNGEFGLKADKYTFDSCAETARMGEVIRTFLFALASKLTAPRYVYERTEKQFREGKKVAEDTPRKATVLKIGESLELNGLRGIITDGVSFVGGHHRSPRRHWRNGCTVHRKNGTTFIRKGCWVMEENEAMEYVIR